MQKNPLVLSRTQQTLERVLMFLLLPTLIACASQTDSSAPTSQPVSSPSEFCAIAKPIFWSAHDTDATILAVKEYNAVGKRLCGWGSQ